MQPGVVRVLANDLERHRDVVCGLCVFEFYIPTVIVCFLYRGLSVDRNGGDKSLSQVDGERMFRI